MNSDRISATTYFLIGFILLTSSACGIVKRGTIPWEEDADSTPLAISVEKNSTNERKEHSEESATEEIEERKEFLQLAYKDWQGIPYKLGGTGYSGIDCSAFMQVVFEDYFLVKIPRTTREQLTEGQSIKKSELETGDLVFFKTGRRTYHVGVMMNEQEFLHASTSNGVTISELGHPYWVETYLSARRIL